MNAERICRICGKKESEHPIWLVRGDWTHDAEWLPMKSMINPEWEALSDKPHFVPLCCLPDQYKSFNTPKYKSVTELAADNPNLGEYLAQLETEQARLQARINELVEQLRRAGGRCNVCGEYLPGHATGGTDICTCV